MPFRKITANGFIEVVNRKALQTPSYTAQIGKGNKDLSFEDTFYNVQAKSAFGMLTLTPRNPSKESRYLEEDIRFISDGKLSNTYE